MTIQGVFGVSPAFYRVICRLALRLVPWYVPVTVHVVVIRTMPVLTVKVALVAPAAMVTVAGLEHAALLSESVTTAPPAGAGAFSVTVAVTEVPPVTLAGLTFSAETAGGSTVSDTLCVPPP